MNDEQIPASPTLKTGEAQMQALAVGLAALASGLVLGVRV
jgi:hypothetical protein